MKSGFYDEVEAVAKKWILPEGPLTLKGKRIIARLCEDAFSMDEGILGLTESVEPFHGKSAFLIFLEGLLEAQTIDELVDLLDDFSTEIYGDINSSKASDAIRFVDIDDL